MIILKKLKAIEPKNKSRRYSRHNRKCTKITERLKAIRSERITFRNQK